VFAVGGCEVLYRLLGLSDRSPRGTAVIFVLGAGSAYVWSRIWGPLSEVS